MWRRRRKVWCGRCRDGYHWGLSELSARRLWGYESTTCRTWEWFRVSTASLFVCLFPAMNALRAGCSPLLTCRHICGLLCMVFSKIPVLFWALTVSPEQIHFDAPDVKIVTSNEQPTAELVLVLAPSSFCYCCAFICYILWHFCRLRPLDLMRETASRRHSRRRIVRLRKRCWSVALRVSNKVAKGLEFS